MCFCFEVELPHCLHTLKNHQSWADIHRDFRSGSGFQDLNDDLTLGRRAHLNVGLSVVQTASDRIPGSQGPRVTAAEQPIWGVEMTHGSADAYAIPFQHTEHTILKIRNKYKREIKFCMID